MVWLAQSGQRMEKGAGLPWGPREEKPLGSIRGGGVSPQGERPEAYTSWRPSKTNNEAGMSLASW